MTTIKDYTDIEQSKKLAKILPLESADMIYTMVNGYHTPFIRIETIKEIDEDDVLCWSIAALLGVLPEGYSSILTKSFNGKDYYCKIDGKPFESKADNPVDACVAMIENLHELKML